MNEKPWLVAVGAGRWQVPGIRAARAVGLSVLAVDGDAAALGFQSADRSLTVDIRNSRAVISAVIESGIRPAGVIAFCNEAGMLTAAALRDHFDLPCSRGSVTRALTNKGLQRAAWTRCGLPCPMWGIARTEEDVPALLAKISGAAIFKPVDSAGSRGVTVIAQGESWEGAFAAALKGSLSGEVIIEAFITGIEHTVETFTHRGKTDVLAVTAKKKVPGTSNTVAYELASAQLSPEKRSEAGTIVSRALAALGYTDGPGHTELLFTETGEIYLVESAGRGGYMVADGIVPQTCGFDMARACAVQAVGQEPARPPNTEPKSVVLRFVPSKAGTVKSISGFSSEDDIDGVISEPIVEVGQVLGRASSDDDRMAFILASGETIDEAFCRADARERRIRIVVESPVPSGT